MFLAFSDYQIKRLVLRREFNESEIGIRKMQIMLPGKALLTSSTIFYYEKNLFLFETNIQATISLTVIGS